MKKLMIENLDGFESGWPDFKGVYHVDRVNLRSVEEYVNWLNHEQGLPLLVSRVGMNPFTGDSAFYSIHSVLETDSSNFEANPSKRLQRMRVMVVFFHSRQAKQNFIEAGTTRIHQAVWNEYLSSAAGDAFWLSGGKHAV